MVRMILLNILAATAGLANGFQPVLPSMTRMPLLMNQQSSSLEPEVGNDNPYLQYTLEDVLTEAAEKFQAIVKNGDSERGIPVLDPMSLGRLSKSIKNDRVDMTFTLNDASLLGLSTIRLSTKPVVDFEKSMISLSFKIQELSLYCDDYDREGTIKPLFREYDASKFDRSLTIALNDIDVKLSLDFDFSDSDNPKLLVKDQDLKLGGLKTDLEDSFVFDFISPVLRGFVEKALDGKIKDAFEPILNSKFQEVLKEQEGKVRIIESVYRKRLKQGISDDDKKPRFLQGLTGVGQLPYPMFWETTAVPVDKLPQKNWKEIKETCKTGDLVLCQGVASGSLMIRRATQSPFSHCIMFVKEEGINDGKPVLIQAAGREFDIWADDYIRGITINDPDKWLGEYTKRWNVGSEDGAVVVFRSLNEVKPRSSEEQEKFVGSLKTFIKDTNGIPYAEGVGMKQLYIMGLVELELTEKQQRRTYYCASFLAQALMEYGVIDREFQSYQYGTRDFSQKYDGVMPYLDGFDYGPEFLVINE